VTQLNGLQILPVWQSYFNHPQGALLGLFGSIFSIGALTGLPFAPLIADRFGRRPAIAVGCVMLFVGAATQSMATDFKMFVCSRFFVGMGCNISQLSSPLLLTEIAHPHHRGKVTALYNCLWNVGAIVAAWTTYGTFQIGNNWSWRIPSALQALPSLIQFVFLYWVPESPRFLIARGKEQEGLEMLVKCQWGWTRKHRLRLTLCIDHGNGNGADETVMFE
jgi:MFS family permease